MPRPIKRPDVKGPRFRGKRISFFNNKAYKEFLKENPKYKDLTLQGFKDIIMTYNESLVQGIIDHRDGVELPEGLGFIFMGACPPAKKKNIDYRKSFNYGIEAEHRNMESDSKLLKIFYTNRPAKYKFRHHQVWSFSAGRVFKRKASNAFKENWALYRDVSPTMKISALYERFRRKNYNDNPVIPETYNEFEL